MARAPKPGDIYIDGLKLGEAILAPATNGTWPVKSKTKTAIKDIIRAKLPCGLYSRYSLTPENLVDMKIGKEASVSAKRGGVVVEQERLRGLFDLPAKSTPGVGYNGVLPAFTPPVTVTRAAQ